MSGLGSGTAAFYELMTAPASKVLDKWFESEPLKATLATDACIGAMTSPKCPGSGYVSLNRDCVKHLGGGGGGGGRWEKLWKGEVFEGHTKWVNNQGLFVAKMQPKIVCIQ